MTVGELIAEIEPIAYGPLALKPDEFWDLTPREFNLMEDGWKWRWENLEELYAWHAANVMAPHLKRPIKPWQLLGRPTLSMRQTVKREKKGGGGDQ